ncbi:MAG: cation transporter [Clostridium sp.]|uniref:heavy-metal-associated domain-containing protein n=1 Tax=Butyribacter sp. TaxID=2822465 RepID=UPI00033F4C09|nr:cation transporter [Clostridium sp.]MDY5180470.1 cation transporter [Butyribacter sp.]CDB89073.1 heavy metal-associated domain protein [Clostridium sp. CAG:253]
MIKTTVGIDGMMCGMCESHVNDAIRKSFDVKKVSSSHSKKKTEIISEEAIDEDKLRAVIDETGYTVLSVDSEPYKKKGFGFFK